MKNITIVGSGSWGVALAIYLAGQGNKIKIWSFAEEERDLINNERKCKFLPNAVIPDGVSCTTDMEEAIEGAEFILHVTPSKFTRNIVKQYKPFIKENQGVVVCSKGFESETMKTLDEIVSEELPNNKIGVLSGPSHAEEVSVLIPTALVVASKDDELMKQVVDAFSSNKMRIYTSKDVKGAELGGALKNIIAFCAGICAGLELGDNTFAALLTRGLLEISRLGVALGGKKDTFYGLTGLGDLIVTCNSMHSRNRRAGMLIGKGYSIEEAKKEVGMVIESIDNIEVAYKLSKLHNIEVPIIDTVYNVLYNNLNPKEAVNMLMTRNLKEE